MRTQKEAANLRYSSNSNEHSSAIVARLPRTNYHPIVQLMQLWQLLSHRWQGPQQAVQITAAVSSHRADMVGAKAVELSR